MPKPCPSRDPAASPFDPPDHGLCMGLAGHDGPHWIKIDKTWEADRRPAWQRAGAASEEHYNTRHQ